MKLMRIETDTPLKLFYREYEEKPLGEDQIRVKTKFAAAKHGTEFTGFGTESVFMENKFDSSKNLFVRKDENELGKFSHNPGNMWVGNIIEVGGNVRNLEVGMRVAGYGSFRTTHTLRAKDALVMPEKMTWQEVMCFDPLQFALGGIRDAHVRAGDVVAIFGMGAIGLMTAQLAKKAGALKVIVCDPIKYRRDIAMANGADYAIDSIKDDAGYIIKELTGNRGADVIVEASGDYRALQSAIRGVAYKGNIAVIGWYHECHGNLNFGWEAHFNQPNIYFTRACSEPNRDYPNWDFKYICDVSWNMLTNGWFKCDNMIDPIVPFDKAAEMYISIYNDPSNSVKLGVTFED